VDIDRQAIQSAEKNAVLIIMHSERNRDALLSKNPGHKSIPKPEAAGTLDCGRFVLNYQQITVHLPPAGSRPAEGSAGSVRGRTIVRSKELGIIQPSGLGSHSITATFESVAPDLQFR
jgi:hypothetical protein